MKSVVAPFTGAWIEIANYTKRIPRRLVAPFTGAWIEIVPGLFCNAHCLLSHPSRVRGLK